MADFGLAKLVEQAGDGLGLTTRVVGTFGYLAPEYNPQPFLNHTVLLT